MTVAQRDYLQAWQKRCYEAGLVGADIPKAYGGGGHEGFQRIANAEMARAGHALPDQHRRPQHGRADDPRHGTEAQKERFIPGALSGEELWCPGLQRAGRRLGHGQPADLRGAPAATSGS